MKYYLDTEFDGPGGPLISIALVREDGRSTYMILMEDAKDPWVQENVIPILWDYPSSTPCIRTRNEENAKKHLEDYFKGDAFPHIIADWPTDFTYFTLLLLHEPALMINLGGITMSVVRTDAYPTDLPGAVQHNAAWDALALKHLLEAPQTPATEPVWNDLAD